MIPKGVWVPGHCVKSAALSGNVLDQPKLGWKAKDDNCAGVWMYASLLAVLLKTIKLWDGW